MLRLSAVLRDRRRRQAGTTLVELLVSVTIMGFALVLIIGTFSTSLLDAAMAKRNTAAGAVIQYEIDKVGGSSFDPDAQGYSDCFATEKSIDPSPATDGSCGSGYTLRADMTVQVQTATKQLWKVSVVSLSSGGQIGSSVSIYKVNR
jgi:type II secretory pathway pseudopilin PulG